MTQVLQIGHMDYRGIRIFQSIYCVSEKQTRFPRSKRKRIRKKWAKDKRNWTLKPAAYMLHGELHCHPDIYRQLSKVAESKRDYKLTI